MLSALLKVTAALKSSHESDLSHPLLPVHRGFSHPLLGILLSGEGLILDLAGQPEQTLNIFRVSK